MTRVIFPGRALHDAFEGIPDEVAHHGTEPPEPHEVYVVPGHEKALSPDVPVVVGDRGTGKSFWSAALNGVATRMVIGRQLQRLRLDSVDVSWGYSSAGDNQSHPSRRVMQRLRKDGFAPEDIWRAIVLYQLVGGGADDFFAGAETWPERVQRVVADPESEERLLDRLDRTLQQQGRRHLIVFDALDRLGDNWATIRDLLQGLLRVALDVRTYRAIRVKLFLRPDMWEDQGMYLPTSTPRQRPYTPSRPPLCSDENAQAVLLREIASPYMGKNRRRGKTYTWLPTHLADAKGQVSPRSFLLALKKAHAVTLERAAGREVTVLHYEGIKQGVQEASRVRQQELHEDYPWIRAVLDPLHGMTVPCSASELRRRWRESVEWTFTSTKTPRHDSPTTPCRPTHTH